MTWNFGNDSGGINPNSGYGLDGTTDYRRQLLGYDPKAALWSQIAGMLQQAGAGIATAPRGQAVGQGLLGVLQGGKQGQDDYNAGLIDKYKYKQLAKQDAQDTAQQAWADKMFPTSAPQAAANPVPFNTAFDAAGVTSSPAGDSGTDPTAAGLQKPVELADVPDNIYRAAYDAANSGDPDGVAQARKILTDWRVKGSPDLPGKVGELQAAIGAGFVPPGTTLDEYARIGQDPKAPIIQDFYEGGQTVQKQWDPATKAWSEPLGHKPTFAPQQAPQPSDFQRKLDEVAKIYAPGSQEYNDAVLNITGAAKSQGMSITTDPQTGAVTVSYGNKAPTEGQAMTSGYYQRANAANDIVNKIIDSGYKPDVITNAVSNLPGGVGNTMISETTQKLQQAKTNFATAVLRKESGAAISNTEFDTVDKQYFPQPGDGPEVLKQKAAARQQVIDSLKLAAGPAAAMSSPASPAATDDPLGIR